MREFKFRIWDKANKTFLCCSDNDDLFINMQGDIYLARENLRDAYDLDYCSNSFYKISQFTGLKNKNGKEIYEDDIVKFCDIRYTKFMVGKIRFNAERGRWMIYPNVGQSRDLTAEKASKCEIIGNIYENPELIGGKNDKCRISRKS